MKDVILRERSEPKNLFPFRLGCRADKESAAAGAAAAFFTSFFQLEEKRKCPSGMRTKKNNYQLRIKRKKVMNYEFLTPAESRSYPSPTATPWEDLRTIMNYEL
jgi:hypothetical protein